MVPAYFNDAQKDKQLGAIAVLRFCYHQRTDRGGPSGYGLGGKDSRRQRRRRDLGKAGRDVDLVL